MRNKQILSTIFRFRWLKPALPFIAGVLAFAAIVTGFVFLIILTNVPRYADDTRGEAHTAIVNQMVKEVQNPYDWKQMTNGKKTYVGLGQKAWEFIFRNFRTNDVKCAYTWYSGGDHVVIQDDSVPGAC